MKVRILPQRVVGSIPHEDLLADLHIIESIYQIRALKAAIELNGKVIDIENKNISNGQIYIETHNIWLQPNTWEKV